MVRGMGRTCQSTMNRRQGSEVLTYEKVRLCYCDFSKVYDVDII